jgi:alanine-synthesizing transaminase
MSKTYSMAGWRIGFAVGNARLIEALARVKSYLDYGAFTPVQAAACAAINGPQDIVQFNRDLYRSRRDVLVESFGRAGWPIPVPQASMFAWAPIPERFHNLGSMAFAKKLLTEGRVAVAPGVGFGEQGEGFVRIALVENEQRPATGRPRREEDARSALGTVRAPAWLASMEFARGRPWQPTLHKACRIAPARC